MSTPTRILLLDDHSLFRESLGRLLESEPDFCIVAHCASVSAAIETLQRTPVDIVLLDYDLGEERGTELLQQLHACKNPAKVLMVTAGMTDRITLDALNAGVAGILYKHSHPSQLVEAIRKIVRGEMWLGQRHHSLPCVGSKRPELEFPQLPTYHPAATGGPFRNS